jgi:cysteinyl-tRNA synthetase
MKAKLILVFLTISTIPAFSENPLTSIHSWAYQLQNLNIGQVASDTSFELIVMDYSANGRAEGIHTAEEVSLIKNSGKKAVCYLSIGEAENYRFYWNDAWDADQNGTPDAGAPSWLGPVNPEWAGNYKVRFWQPEWQSIVFTYIDTIYARGYDGIYCDIIDAYEYWSDANPGQPAADSLMISFVLKIREHITGLTAETFFIVPQNAEEIVKGSHVSDTLKTAYFSAIDGIGVEDVFFPGDLDENNPFRPATGRIQLLQEYLSNQDLIPQYVAEAEKYGFIPYVARRELDTLNPGIVLSVASKQTTAPGTYLLNQNYPNPFNPSTRISYSVPSPDFVSLKVYDELGREVQTLVNEFQLANNYSVSFAAKGLASGIYSYQLRLGHGPVETKKMVLVH